MKKIISTGLDMSDRREAELLDALEDAQEAHARDRLQLKIGLWLLLIGVVASIVSLTGLSLLHSVGVNWGPGSVLIGVITLALAFVGSAITFGTWVEDLPHSRQELKTAQRAHRYHLMN